MSVLVQDPDKQLPDVQETHTSPIVVLESVQGDDVSVENPYTEQKQDEVNDTPDEEEEEQETTRCQKYSKHAFAFYIANQFPIHIISAILLARAYPPLGADYLQPEITATIVAVAIIFVLAGLGLKTEELAKAFKRLYFNSFVQFFNFGVVSIVVFCASRLLTKAHMLDKALADGMVICASLPMAINVVIVLTAAIGGDEAAAVFNATFGNIVGIFLSPVLILAYLGTTGNISLGEVFSKLTLRVVVPLVVGQVVQKTFAKVREVFKTHKKKFKKVQESMLVYVVYTVFCKTFENDAGAGIGQVFLMILYQFLLMIFLMTIAWYSLRFFFHDEPELRAMGVFGCVQKTVALGVPLISSIYEGDPNEGLYTLPILIWHPMQLVIGSMLVPRLKSFVESERERLNFKEEQEIDQTVVADIEGQDEEEAGTPGNNDNNDAE